jgi:methylmalonyl-CoA/ethylmalonyl-CoA epimerase
MDDILQCIHHVGIAVDDMEAGRALYRDTLGLKPGLHRLMMERGVEVQFFDLPGARIELLAPRGESSSIAKFLADRGPGLHHICYEVNDIHAALATLTGRGLRAIDTEPRDGAEGKLVAFLHPRSAGGVLIELQQK